MLSFFCSRKKIGKNVSYDFLILELARCPFGEMSDWRDVRLARCPVGEMSGWRDVRESLKVMYVYSRKIINCHYFDVVVVQ